MIINIKTKYYPINNIYFANLRKGNKKKGYNVIMFNINNKNLLYSYFIFYDDN